MSITIEISLFTFANYLQNLNIILPTNSEYYIKKLKNIICYTLELLISYLFIKLYNVLTCTPVAPFGKYPSGLDRYAVPAISR